MDSKFSVVERILLTLWVGGLWTVGFLAVPILFHELDDRRMAGELAGQLFAAINYIGLVCGIILLVNIIYREAAQWYRGWRSWLIVSMLVFVCFSQFILHPMIVDIKGQGDLLEGSELAKRFGMIHGISSSLYTLTSLLGLILVIFGLRRQESG